MLTLGSQSGSAAESGAAAAAGAAVAGEAAETGDRQFHCDATAAPSKARLLTGADSPASAAAEGSACSIISQLVYIGLTILRKVKSLSNIGFVTVAICYTLGHYSHSTLLYVDNVYATHLRCVYEG